MSNPSSPRATSHLEAAVDGVALSVVVPFFNEAGNVLPLIDEVHRALDGVDYEVLCVNDGSTDDTAAEIAEAVRRMPSRVTALTHVARRGKSAALFTALRAARGAWVQVIDGDGQNDPADVRRIWNEVVSVGDDPRLGLVCGRRTSRHDGAFKRVQSRVANGVSRFCLGDDTTDAGCGFKLLRRRAFADLPYFASVHRFIPALIKRAGWTVREESVRDRPRVRGVSKYGFWNRLGPGLVDLVGVMWLVRRGACGIAAESNDARRE